MEAGHKQQHSGSVEHAPISDDLAWRQAWLVFLAMVLCTLVIAIFAAIAFSFGDTQAATILAGTAILVMLGLIVQMLLGLNQLLRLYYGLCGAGLFLYVVLRGGQDISDLAGVLAMVPGFVVVLGWRLAAVFLGTLLAATATVFVSDSYMVPADALSLLVELKFFVAFAGLALFSLGVGHAVDTSQRELLADYQRVSMLAYKDAMTGLANRRASEDLLVYRWEEFKRGGPGFAVLLCNIDDFKKFNQLFGRDFGDGVIIRIANVLVHSLRNQDVISRWGGDEFLVLLPGASQKTALQVAERIRRRVDGVELSMGGERVPVSVSIGVAAVDLVLGPSDLLNIANAGVFQAKQLGKNRVVPG